VAKESITRGNRGKHCNLLFMSFNKKIKREQKSIFHQKNHKNCPQEKNTENPLKFIKIITKTTITI
jgi:hypothetical protein